MKKQVSPVPTPRAAALLQSASRYAAGAASAWQNIAGNSARLADANRRANGPGRAPLAPGQAAPPDDIPRSFAVPTHPTLAPGQRPEPEETIRQVGWREVERAVGVSTKRKYNYLGIGFGPKVPVFETEKVTVPVYQETDRNKRYYAAVKQEEVARVKREGLKAEFGGDEIGGSVALKTVEQFNSLSHIYFFNNQASVQKYGQANFNGNYAIVEFVIPEYHDFSPSFEEDFNVSKVDAVSRISTRHNIPAMHIKSVKYFHKKND